MKLMSLEFQKQQKIEKKVRNELTSKKLESKVFLELQDKLDEYLILNDKVMIEVNPTVLGEFINLLDDRVLTMYDFEQIDKNKFIFYNKEIDF